MTINIRRMVIWLIRLLQNLPAVAEDCLNPKVSLTGLGVRQAGNEGRFRGVPFFWSIREGLTVSAERAFEHLMFEILRQAREASRDPDDLDVLFSCLSMLEIGLIEAQACGIVFESAALRELDPYCLLDQLKPSSPQAQCTDNRGESAPAHQEK
ncbi:MAG: hypothetical protein E6Q44_09345 [Flavobacteriales bacterium]|nr:MAG: hypothetical protein E6Q44_09345 [Flavobacteriales bacterium]